jgi:hypothetical protein
MKLQLASLLFSLFSSIPIFGQDVAIVTTGQGRSLEDAKLNALRTAVEQAFGAFISSKTEIINDELLDDEIVTITNGNIKEFTIVDQWSINQEQFIIVRSIVSLSTLSNYLQYRGHNEISFNGNTFSYNIKLQKLNEDSEVTSLRHLCNTFLTQSESILDYKLIVSEPILYPGQTENYKVSIIVRIFCNVNHQEFLKRIEESLRNLSMTSEEIEEYKAIGKPVYKLTPLLISEKNYELDILNKTPIYFRSKLSIDIFQAFILCANLNAISTINILNDIRPIYVANYIELNKSLDSDLQNGIFTVCEEWCDYPFYWNHDGPLPFRAGNFYVTEYLKAHFKETDFDIWRILSFRGYDGSNWTNDWPNKGFLRKYSILSKNEQLDLAVQMLASKKISDVNSFTMSNEHTLPFEMKLDLRLTLSELEKLSHFTLD